MKTLIQYFSLQIRIFGYIWNKSDDYLCLYIKNPSFKPTFGSLDPYEFAWAGREL